MSERDDFKEAVIRRLGDSVNLLCSNPECRARTKGPHSVEERAINLGVAAHIHAAASGPGAKRHDPNQTPAQRSSYENGIWLCQTCSAKIDKDEQRYTPRVLKAWKELAEAEAEATVGKPAALFASPAPVVNVTTTTAKASRRMSDAALELLTNIAQLYVDAGFPNLTWWFLLPNDHPPAGELRALQFLRMDSTKGPNGTQWCLTVPGHNWVMENRPDIGLRVEARRLFRTIGREYKDMGSPPLHGISWPANTDEEDRLFHELQGEGLVEEHTAAKWRLTEAGASAIGSV